MATVKLIPYVNISFELEDFCTYEGDCLRKKSMQDFLCYVCKYMKPMDIPAKLNAKYKELCDE